MSGRKVLFALLYCVIGIFVLSFIIGLTDNGDKEINPAYIALYEDCKKSINDLGIEIHRLREEVGSLNKLNGNLESNVNRLAGNISKPILIENKPLKQVTKVAPKPKAKSQANPEKY